MTAFHFPLWYLLIPFSIVLLATTVYMFFNIYHIAKFGMQSFGTTVVLLLYFGGYLAVLGVVGVMVSNIDWHHTVTVIEILPFTGSSTSTFGL